MRRQAGYIAAADRRCRKKKGLQEAFEAEVVAEVEALIGAGAADGIDFEAIETTTRREALKVAARAIERRLNADTSDHAGPTLPCACGELAQYGGRHDKTFETVVGAVTLSRAYYHCDGCEGGFFPRDRDYGMEGGSLSPAVLRMTGLVAARVSFEESEELLRELAGVRVETKHVERAAEALGAQIAEDERRMVEEPSPDEVMAPTLYLGMDGTGVPARAEEIEGRDGKQEDGTARTREAKLCTVWSAEGRDKEGTPVRDIGSVSYTAAIESAAMRDTDETISEFAQRAAREARRRGFDRARRCVVLGDGAPWIWNIALELFPDAIQIVDRYHAKERLSAVAKAIWGPTSDLGRQWGKQRHDDLDAGETDALKAALAVHARSNDEARKCVGYIDTNRSRMRYPEFRAVGLCTSTGVPCGWLRCRHRRPPQASGHAVDGPRRQHHHRLALRHPQRPVRGLTDCSAALCAPERCESGRLRRPLTAGSGAPREIRTSRTKQETRNQGNQEEPARETTMPLEHEDLTGAIIGAAIVVHKELGPGFLESVYDNALAIELRRRAIPFQRQLYVPVLYQAVQVGEHRLDYFVSDLIVVELKAAKDITDLHFAVVRSYLRAVQRENALILNFAKLTLEVKRVHAS